MTNKEILILAGVTAGGTLLGYLGIGIGYIVAMSAGLGVATANEKPLTRQELLKKDTNELLRQLRNKK